MLPFCAARAATTKTYPARPSSSMIAFAAIARAAISTISPPVAALSRHLGIVLHVAKDARDAVDWNLEPFVVARGTNFILVPCRRNREISNADLYSRHVQFHNASCQIIGRSERLSFSLQRRRRRALLSPIVDRERTKVVVVDLPWNSRKRTVE